MDEHFEANRKLWDAWTDIHVEPGVYGIESFRQGQNTLCSIEREELGDVNGKSLLHLQCHFGMDTLSWARLGAKVTGVDFSERSIAEARALADELGLSAEFVCSNVYELPEKLTGPFDIVFTSIGVLAWLPDLAAWGRVIAHFLVPGGTFYIREIHPFTHVFDDEDASEPVASGPYFNTGEALQAEKEGSYADREAPTKHMSYQWLHSLGETINALIDAGLQIEFLHEFPFNTFKSIPWLTQGTDGLWRYEGVPNSIPLMFSIKATKSQHAEG